MLRLLFPDQRNFTVTPRLILKKIIYFSVVFFSLVSSILLQESYPDIKVYVVYIRKQQRKIKIYGNNVYFMYIFVYVYSAFTYILVVFLLFSYLINIALIINLKK